ncbi:hypothetical protein [Yersinia enterocolitica]|uniref:hypothetical protein n=1 Tax=Yersinia enterocolitica TaxID=630 RepID=UPI0028924B1F|nr:hypothetical protein [Yersinia enterocolitica]
MNNLEELREHCEEMMTISPMRYAYIPASSIITLIDRIEKAAAELSAAQKELGDLHNQEFQQRLANAEHQLYMKDLAIHNIKASRKAQFRKRLTAEAALSAANEKLSKPVVLDKYWIEPASHWNEDEKTMPVDEIIKAIKAAGFTVEGNADAE